MRVLLAGGSGMIGSALNKQLQPKHQVRSLTRTDSGDYRWTGASGSVPAAAVEWADAVVSLNGASLSRLPWTKAYRDKILSSRVQTTRALSEAISAANNPPQVWLSASAVGFYGDRGDEALNERAAAGRGFLANVVRNWEAATAAAQAATRVVTARTGLVLAREGALKPISLVTQLGLAARIGTGRQWWPWISLNDEVRAIEFVLETPSIVGPVNLTGPTPATADDITRALATTLHRPHLLMLPTPLIRLVMGQASELLLDSQKVIPQKLIDAGFDFQDQTPTEAINEIWARD